jgi:hypothetical protein
MNYYLLIIIKVLFIIKCHSGAPAPSTSLPNPPYTFNKGTLLSVGVVWDNESIKDYLPKNLKLKNATTGGLDIYFTKNKEPISKINYALLWINLKNNNKKLIIGFIGSSFDTNRLIEKVSERTFSSADNRLMIINNKVSTRTKINNKLIFNTSAKIIEKCTNDIIDNKYVISSDTNKKYSIKINSTNACDLSDIKIAFSGKYQIIKINEILWGKLSNNTIITFDNE